MSKNIYVTQPNLPPLEQFIPYLEQIWDNKILTNNGPFHKQLEQALCNYLGVEHIALFANGTIALVTALRALGITGEVITTPYSFVATAHSLIWNNLKPVFVDIDPRTCNLDPDCIEAAITSQTRAILPVHCYGIPCAVEDIQSIANTHGLKVIYDAAHAFGVQYKGESLLKHGDLSVLSFHATKVFNTFEGGAIVCSNFETKNYIDQLKNFGFVGETEVVETGINGKMNEVQAAFGLLQLKHIDAAIERRRQIDFAYCDAFKNTPGLRCRSLANYVRSNYSYFQIFIEKEYPLSRDQLYEKLKINGIYGRRYFYPLITDFSMYRDLPSAKAENLTVAKRIANNVICLPIYPGLTDNQVNDIIALIK